MLYADMVDGLDFRQGSCTVSRVRPHPFCWFTVLTTPARPPLNRRNWPLPILGMCSVLCRTPTTQVRWLPRRMRSAAGYRVGLPGTDRWSCLLQEHSARWECRL